MPQRAGVRFWVELGLAAIAAALFVLTLVSREWIEEIFGFDPDGGSGALEWSIVVASALATLAFSLMARAEWKRRTAATN